MKPPSCSLLHIPVLLLALSLSAHGAVDYGTPYVFTTLAGLSSFGSQDAAGADARFFSPQDAVTDAAGNVFIVDTGNHTIRKITPAGVVSTFAGTPGEMGSADGTGTAARFSDPQGLATDAAGNLYVADTGNHTIRRITPAGAVFTFAGLAGVTGSVDGVGPAARFNRPLRLALSPAGDVFVTEAGNNAIRKITPSGGVSTFATGLRFPETNDIGAHASVSYGAIAVDATGNVYVSAYEFTAADSVSTPSGSYPKDRYVGYVHRLTPTGGDARLWETSVTRSYRTYYDGQVSNDGVSALTFDANGQLVATIGYHVVRYSPLADGTPNFVTLAGNGSIGSADGPATAAKFGFPLALAYDRNGALYIADAGNNAIRKLTTAGEVTTVAGFALERAVGSVDGTGAAARFVAPAGLATDAVGNVYVADTAAHCIRKISVQGEVTTVAGAPGIPGYADGPATTARFNGPRGLVIGADGTVYVADTNNHTIRRISPTGETTTYAGLTTASGWYDGRGSGARFSFPRAIVSDGAGGFYVTSARTIRKIDPTGEVTTLAGLNSLAGYVDGLGSAARFNSPQGLAIDGTGNLYVTDVQAGTSARIRKITPAGAVTTLAGAEQGHADGTFATARFYEPSAISADDMGNLYVADSYSQTIRKIGMTGDAAGTVTTLAGLPDAPGGTDGTGRAARFFFPQGIAVDILGHLYVTSGSTVRKGERALPPQFTGEQPASQTVNAGANATFSVTATGTPAPTYQWYFNGNAIASANGSTLTIPNIRASDAGDYTVVVTNSLGSATSNKAALTVNAPAPILPAAGGGGGGGGAPSMWFAFALAVLGAIRRCCYRTPGAAA